MLHGVARRSEVRRPRASRARGRARGRPGTRRSRGRPARRSGSSPERLAEPQLARRAGRAPPSGAGVEADADRARVARLRGAPPRAERLEPPRSTSRRSWTRRWSTGSPPGHSRRKSSRSRCRQTTPLESSIEPPGRSPFSRTSTRAPRAAASAAATSPAIPAPATTRSAMGGSDEREARLVLDVLELDPVGPPDEDGARVRRRPHVRDLDPARARLALDVVGASRRGTPGG